MAMTKSTIIEWASYADQMDGEDFFNARHEKIHQMILEGKTDGYLSAITPETTLRDWLDQAAAEEYASFITNLAAQYNKTIVNITFQDKINPPYPLN